MNKPEDHEIGVEEDHEIGVEIERDFFRPWGVRIHAVLWIDDEEFDLGHYASRWTAKRAARRYAQRKLKEWYTEPEHITIQIGRDG